MILLQASRGSVAHTPQRPQGGDVGGSTGQAAPAVGSQACRCRQAPTRPATGLSHGGPCILYDCRVGSPPSSALWEDSASSSTPGRVAGNRKQEQRPEQAPGCPTPGLSPTAGCGRGPSGKPSLALIFRQSSQEPTQSGVVAEADHEAPLYPSPSSQSSTLPKPLTPIPAHLDPADHTPWQSIGGKYLRPAGTQQTPPLSTRPRLLLGTCKMRTPPPLTFLWHCLNAAGIQAIFLTNFP